MKLGWAKLVKLKLTKLIKPHIGLITNIGEAHIENFKNIQEESKIEIIEGIEIGGSIVFK